MSDKINRYSIINAGIAYDINGEWCRAEDIELLEQQNADLLELLKEVIEHGYIENDWYARAEQTLAKYEV